MIIVISIFLLAIAVSVFTFGRHDQMHVIADDAHLYKADSLTAQPADHLNYGETVKIVPDRPEIINNGVTWVEATSLRGSKGYIPKNISFLQKSTSRSTQCL